MNMQAMNDMDTFRRTKQDFYQGRASEEELRQAAIKILQNKIAAEIKIKGRASSGITAKAIASLMR
jgi:hypothetical protein